MKSLVFFGLFVGMSFCLGCRSSVGREETDACRAVVRVASPGENTLSGLVEADSLFFIRLEKTDSSLLGVVSSVEVFENRIIVKDMLVSKGIYIFDRKGRFIRRPTVMGQGPQEFITLSDFKINKKKKELVVLDRYAKTMTFFDLDGNFIERKKIDFIGEYFTILPDGKYVFFSDSSKITEKNTVTVTDEDLNVLCTYYGTEQNHNFILGVPTRLATNEEGEAMFSPPYDGKVYQVSDTSFFPAYCLEYDFGTPIPHEEVLDITPFGLASFLAKNGYILNKGNFIENRTHWKMDFIYNGGLGELYTILYEKATGKSKTLKLQTGKDPLERLFSDVKGRDGDYFIAIFDPNGIERILASESSLAVPQAFKDSLSSVDREDNPLLVFYSLKPFEHSEDKN